MKLPVAVQLYSVRNEMERDFYGTIAKMKEFGYDGVEFAGLFGREPRRIKEFCKETGIVPISAHVPYYDMLADPAKVLADYAEIRQSLGGSGASRAVARAMIDELNVFSRKG